MIEIIIGTVRKNAFVFCFVSGIADVADNFSLLLLKIKGTAQMIPITNTAMRKMGYAFSKKPEFISFITLKTTYTPLFNEWTITAVQIDFVATEM